MIDLILFSYLSLYSKTPDYLNVLDFFDTNVFKFDFNIENDVFTIENN
ncbi:N-acetylmuramoyl-L-alanine amidase, partial [Borreliella burgdorferi]|nr:N-acetylmuramoyl-L-alanine amidase [Borreliella burgdorferi]